MFELRTKRIITFIAQSYATYTVCILSHFNIPSPSALKLDWQEQGFGKKSKFKMETWAYIFPLKVVNPILYRG